MFITSESLTVGQIAEKPALRQYESNIDGVRHNTNYRTVDALVYLSNKNKSQNTIGTIYDRR